MRNITLGLLCLITFQLFAQPILLPHIGGKVIPNYSDAICKIPWYLGSFYKSGLTAGTKAHDFTLFDLKGDSLNLKKALSNHRPVLLVAGSYTCFVYRDKVPIINDLFDRYAGLLDVYIIYNLEAHPYIDTSVYFGKVNTSTRNISENILIRQPTTYGERKAVISEMVQKMTIKAPIFIDGPCNAWWSTFGPAPNNAYLIDTTGTIIAKHGWFDRYPDQIYCDIDSLLGTQSGKCNKVKGGKSSFSFKYISNDTVIDPSGATISVDAELENLGSEDILIYARKLNNDLPNGWESSMCIDVCYSSSTDSTTFVLSAGAVQPVHVYFYPSIFGVGTGYVRLGFKNLNNSNNTAMFHAYGSNEMITSTKNTNDQQSVIVYPNPVNNEMTIQNIEQVHDIYIFNLLGKLAKTFNKIDEYNSYILNVQDLVEGVYYLNLIGTKGSALKKIEIIR